jgi:hypothetical protein
VILWPSMRSSGIRQDPSQCPLASYFPLPLAAPPPTAPPPRRPAAPPPRRPAAPPPRRPAAPAPAPACARPNVQNKEGPSWSSSTTIALHQAASGGWH